MTNILEDGATADRDDHIMVEGVGEHNDAATEDDSGDETQHSSSNQKNVSQRRRTQNAKFEDYLLQRADPKNSESTKPAGLAVPDDLLSTAHLLAKQDAISGALDPREYQVELFERAKSRNTIAVLETGSGKTLIAVLLLKYVLHNELNDRAQGIPNRIAFFLVDSVTLVFQQAAVLRNNLDQSVAHFYGAMGTDFWSKQTWQDHFEKNMAVVCTAEILNQCLLNAFIRMDQINLLIFDEAHHAKKDHPYARIIKDSYMKEMPSKRPRIFGMTASPIDGKGDVVNAAVQLETLLDSAIATTSKPSFLRRFFSRPSEKVWKYSKLNPPFATGLHRDLKDQFGDISVLESSFRYSWDASSELGKWCSDRVWVHAVADKVRTRLEGRMSFTPTVDSTRVPVEASEQMERIRIVGDLVKEATSPRPTTPEDLSSKVHVLREGLQTYFERATNTKCIVFVEQRLTAKILCELFTELKIPNLRPGVLVGLRSGDAVGMNMTYRQLFRTVIKFRNGEINCLFATSVAEEGLDIPDCNLVVMFDLYHHLIQFVQSRGRARHVDSAYVSMIEEDNVVHEARLEEVRHSEGIMKRFCELLPEDRLLDGNDRDMDTILEKEAGKRTYVIRSTGAKLTYHSAMAILSRYASSLHYEKGTMESDQVTYVILPFHNGYICETILPEKSPVRGVVGEQGMRKSTAKQSAAFDTCLMLRKAKLLDEHFRSVYQRRLPAMRNARLALNCKKTNQYEMATKPEFWQQKRGSTPAHLHATILTFSASGMLRRKHQSLILLTRERLPDLPSFPLFLEDDIETQLQFTSMHDPLTPTDAELLSLTTFTLRVFRDVFHKIYEPCAEQMPYWLCPAVDIDVAETHDPRGVIDWGSLQFVIENEDITWSSNMNYNSLHTRFVYDPWDGRHRYFPLHVDESLKPSDPAPEYVQRRRHMDTIMTYSVSLSKNARSRFLESCDWSQPVVRAELVRLRRNFLDKMTDSEKAVDTRSVVCLEPLRISAIPSSVAASCLAFPAVISRIDSYLIALEGCQKLHLVLRPEYALEAFTKDSDNTEEHRNQQIHFQRGMGKNYERLEFLGDCFLKMATSMALFAQNPDDDEFDYHVQRMCLICNKNLFNTAVQKEIFVYIRSRGFSRRAWYPDGLRLLQGKDHSKKSSSETKHALSEKTIADVCEALIGASLLSGGPQHRFDMAVRAVTAVVNSSKHDVSSWDDYYQLYTIPPYQVQRADGYEADLATKIEAKLGYRFQYPRLLRSAFTHPSYPFAWSKVPCYQRLEFLGDSLLDMVCVEDLFARFPDRDPQWLTEHKMAMVSNKFLGFLAVKLGLHTHLQHYSNPLLNQITQYAEEVQMEQTDYSCSVDFWVTTKDPPKCLPDMVEAYLGAAFVDSQFRYEVVEDFFQRHVKPYFHDMTIYDSFANKHPTTYLHNKLTNEFGCKNYCLKAGEIPGIDGDPPTVLAAVIVHEGVMADGWASSGRYAKIKASERALAVLEELTVSDFREKYGCDCKRLEDGEPLVEVGTAI